LQKANKLGVKIISEQEFMAMIGGDSSNNETTPEQPAEETKAEPIPIQGSLF
jgi:BRCT domain type II-containing protein